VVFQTSAFILTYLKSKKESIGNRKLYDENNFISFRLCNHFVAQMRRVFASCQFHGYLHRTNKDFVILEKYFLKGGGNLAPIVYRLLL
jgi:hypothetical protein